ncbi:hypothetical protein Trihar35433_5982 [Trichoderma harzianum]|nr:hypothetical protein Trihar35433_5982 [Trichoderma harzianum]
MTRNPRNPSFARMMRNPNRSSLGGRIVDRGSSYQISMAIDHAIHGSLRNDEGEAASLLLLGVKFRSFKAKTRLTEAEISLQFQPYQDSDQNGSNNEAHEQLEICNIAPKELSISEEHGNNSSKICGIIEKISARQPFHTASWKIMESPEQRNGLPETIGLAVLLSRKSHAKFSMIPHIKVKSSGLSFDGAATALGGFRGDPIMIDPASGDYLKPVSPESHASQVNSHSLDEVDLNAFVSDFFAHPKFPSRLEVEEAERRENAELAAIEKRLDSVDGTTGSVPMGKENFRTDLEPFNGIWAEQWPRNLDDKLLAEYFPWLGHDDVAPSVTDAPKSRFQQLKKSGFKDFSQLNEVLNDTDVDRVLDKFALPAAYLSTRKDKNGSCYSKITSNDEAEVYAVQTPIYGDEFWYFLLLRSKISERIAVALFADSAMDAKSIIKEVHRSDTTPHHLLLLVELFTDHFKRTLSLFHKVINSINDVDDFLLEVLPQRDPSVSHGIKDAYFKGTSKEFRRLTLQYTEISYKLHLERMDLVRLRRRRDFEQKLAALLQNALTDELHLSRRMLIYTSRASPESELENLSQRIDSQSSVIYSLVAQQEAQLQYSLTLGTVRDARSMKTLSVITIVFLPGAFFATLFSTNMFKFSSINQEVGVYFAIVVPLTVMLLVAWRAWVNNRLVMSDIESDTAGMKKEKKQDKRD